MKYVPSCTGRAVLYLLAVGVANYFAIANAQVRSGQVFIKAVHGAATYSTGGPSIPLAQSLILSRGAVIKTGADATVDLVLQYNGTVLRLLPNSTLKFDKLDKENAAEGIVTETSLNLTSGSILGSQRKLAPPSQFEVNIPGGKASIKGTEYLVRADGAVTVLSGSVDVVYNLPGNQGSVKVTVSAGQSFDPATGQVVTTTSAFLQNIVADIDTLRQNAEVFKAGGATIVVKPQGVMSPTRGHGNNGVGNGVDPQPPGNPPINDGPGTGPGNPGNRGHGNQSPHGP